MSKTFKTAVAAVILGAGVSSVMAASTPANKSITITGCIVSHTCDVTVGQPSLDLKSWMPADFTAANTGIGNQQFGVSLTNCRGELNVGDSDLAVDVSSTEVNSADAGNLWGNGTANGVGIKLKSRVAGTTTWNDLTPVSNHITVIAAPTMPGVPHDLTLNPPPSVSIDASLAAPDISTGVIGTGDIKANLTFDMAL